MPKISPKTEVVTLPKPTVDVPERIKPQYPTEEIIQTMLYGGDGAIIATHMDGILANWKKNGATLLYGKYIYTYTQGKFNYFVHTFNSSGTFTPSANFYADYLVVAGGGGGGNGVTADSMSK